MKRDVGITIFLIGIIISSIVISPFVLDFTLIARYIALSVFVLILIRLVYKSYSNITLKPDLILIWYVCYILFSCCSVFWAKNKSEALFESSKLLLSFFVFVMVYFFLKKAYHYFIVTLVKISLFIFILEFAILVYQFSLSMSFEKAAMYDLTGINGHKNLVSSFLFLNMFFLLLAFFRLANKWKFFAGICILLSLMMIFNLQTKAVWIGIVIAFISYLMFRAFQFIRKQRKFKMSNLMIIIITVLAANIFFIAILPVVIKKGIHHNKEISIAANPNENETELDNERLTIWDKTYHVFEKKPLIGVGIGNWQIFYPVATLAGLWRCEDLNVTFQRPHNDFLWILSETGLIGFNLFLLFLIGIVVLLFNINSNTVETTIKYEVILLPLFIIGFYSISFFDFPKERMEHLIWINIIMGIAYYHIKQQGLLNSFKALAIHKLYYAAAFVMVMFILCIGILRYKGEYYTRNLYVYKNTGDYLNVISSYKNAKSFAYSLDPVSLPLAWYSGNANASLGNYESAKTDFKKAYRLNPYNRNVLNDLASAYAFTNQTDSAIYYFTEAARISPRFDDAKLNLAAMYIKAQNYKTASMWLKAVLHASPRRSNYEKIVQLNLK